MGVEYALVNHKHKTIFDMGKNTYDLIRTIANNWPLSREAVEDAVAVWSSAWPPVDSDSWLVDRILEFMGDATELEVGWSTDANDDFWDLTTKHGYRETGSRYPQDYEPGKKFDPRKEVAG